MAMKCIVLVPGNAEVPWARRWISVVLAALHRWPLLLRLSSVYLTSSPVSGLKAFPCKAHWGGSLAQGASGVTSWTWAAQWLPEWLHSDQQSGCGACWVASAQGRWDDAVGGVSAGPLAVVARVTGASSGGRVGAVGLLSGSWRSSSLFLAATLRDLGSVVTWA